MNQDNREQQPTPQQTMGNNDVKPNNTDGMAGEQQPAAGTESQPAENANSTGTSSSKNNLIPLVIGAIIIALIMIAGAWYFMNNTDQAADNSGITSDPLGGEGTAFEFEEGDPNEVVAVVNGVELLREQFNETRGQIAQAAQQQGLTPDTEGAVDQINDQAIETLVNTELLLQAADEANVTVEDGAVESQMQEIINSVGGEDQLASSLEEVGLTEEGLREELAQEALLQAYLDANLGEFTATEEEINAMYEQASQAGSSLPPLEEVRDQVEQQVILTKRQEATSQLIEQLRAEAEVEVLI